MLRPCGPAIPRSAGRDMVINREHDDDLALALGDAFAAAHRSVDTLEA